MTGFPASLTFSTYPQLYEWVGWRVGWLVVRGFIWLINAAEICGVLLQLAVGGRLTDLHGYVAKCGRNGRCEQRYLVHPRDGAPLISIEGWMRPNAFTQPSSRHTYDDFTDSPYRYRASHTKQNVQKIGEETLVKCAGENIHHLSDTIVASNYSLIP